MSHVTYDVAIVGAGPAGLTAGYLLSKEGKRVVIFEADPDYVGGISKTVVYKGFRFDIGGHRFFSKSEKVESLWDEMMFEEMLVRPRLSKIYYNKRFFCYPLKPLEALTKLGVVESILCVLSYIQAQLFPNKNPKNFTQWVTNKFGARLFRIFFKSYTEKIWGMKCDDISADWAAQRIVGLSLWTAITSTITSRFKRRSKTTLIKSMISTFRYPRRGPGMLWESCAKKIEIAGGQIKMGANVDNIGFQKNSGLWEISAEKYDGTLETVQANHVISSAPLRSLSKSIQPKPSQSAITAANSLNYRDFITVVLIIKDRISLPDNWIYIHDADVKVGRIQNYLAWSPDMIPDEEHSSLGLEYFCFQDDALWSKPDQKLIELGVEEVKKIGLFNTELVVDACVVRQPKAYPVYDDHYEKNVEILKTEFGENYPNLHLVGRNGMHKYNNQDHAMMTAMLTVENIKTGRQKFDVWSVNQDAQYHEELDEGDVKALESLRLTPQKV